MPTLQVDLIRFPDQEGMNYDNIKHDPIAKQQFEDDFKQKIADSCVPLISPDKVQILNIAKGSIVVHYDIHAMILSQTSLSYSVPGENNLIIKTQDFFIAYNKCQQYDIDYRDSKHEPSRRGRETYKFPDGCQGFGLKVEGNYDNGDNTWLGMKNVRGEWYVRYHGTNKYGMEGIMKTKEFSIQMEQKFENRKCLRANKTIGKGCYVSDLPKTALKYANSFKVENYEFKVIFMNRCNPITMKQANENYYVINSAQDIRPCRILLFQN